MKSRYEKASLGFIVILSLLLFTLLEIRRQQIAPVPFRSEAQQSYVLNTEDLAVQPQVVETEAATFFDYQAKPQAELFSLRDDSTANVINFLNNKPTHQSEQIIPDKPSNFTLIDSIDDSKQLYLQALGLETKAKHYYFNQTRCGGIPVYGSIVQIDTKGGKDVIGISGRTITNDPSCTSEQSSEQMANLALSTFKREESVTNARVVGSVDMVYNGQLSGAEGAKGGIDDPKSYLTKAITVCISPESAPRPAGASGDCIIYFVDQSAGGGIVRRLDTEVDIMNRTVSSGSVVRREGQPATGNQGVDKAYDILGDIYNYYFNTHQRDSADGKGLPLRLSISNCNPNAYWNHQSKSMVACGTGLISSDVLGHELQHGVTQFAVGGLVGLEYQYQSGALNESISDVFGYLNDPNDWTMGEETSIGVIRDLSNPPRRNNPDRLSSTFYVCGAGDRGGVHINSGVFNKAFYLMVDGGTAGNDKGQCTITGITKEKAGPVVYRALTTYMKGKTSGNYCDMYNAMNDACTDLYQDGSTECAQVKAAMQAVEMDQQQLGKIKPPSCPFRTASVPSCAAGASPSTNCTGGSTGGPGGGATPTPASGGPGTGATPTPGGTGTTPPIGGPGSATPTLGASTPTPRSAPTTQPTPLPTATPIPQGPVTIFLSSSASQAESLTGIVEIKKEGARYAVTATIDQVPEDFDQFSYEGKLLGENKVSVGKFRKDGSKLSLSFTSADNLLNFNGFEVLKSNNGTTEITILSGSSVPAESARGVTLKIKVNFQKMATDNRLVQSLPVRVGIGGSALSRNVYSHTTFTSAGIQGCPLTGRENKHRSVAIHGNTWKAQTFTPPATGPLKKIRIWGYRDRTGQEGPMIRIREVDSQGAPNASANGDLASARLDMSTGLADFGGRIALVEGRQYAMVITDESNTETGAYWMYFINSSNCYYQQDSSSYTSTNSGVAWTKDISDFFFTIHIDTPAWIGQVNFPDIQPGENYKVLVKGGKHRQTRVCQSRPTEQQPGTYGCGDGEIRLENGVNELNFTGILQMAGDLPRQDGVVNSADLVQIRTRLNSTEPSDIEIADLNGDGVVNAIDDAMVIATFSNRSDGQ